MALDIGSISPTLSFPPGGEAAAGVSPQTVAAAGLRQDAPKPATLIPSDLQQTLHDLQKLSEAFNTHLSFSVNQKLDSIVVKVVDSQTDKVVREIPPAELQHVYEAIRETIGLLFDKKA